MSWTLCTSGAAIAKAGVNYDLAVSGALLAEFSNEAEGTFCMKTRKDWIAGSAAIQTNLKPAIADAVSCDIGNKIINFNSAGYLKGEAQTMLDVNKDTYDNIIKDLREDQFQKLNK